jgi:zinc protease
MSVTTGVVKRVLPNGLTVLAQRSAAAPVVAVVTHVRAGYFDEPDEWVGIAHVMEHMYFKGTGRRGPGEIARETQLLGGYINAGTIYDKTVYYTVLPSLDGGLAKALDVQADALMHAALDADELRRELEVIIQEANRKLDAPGAVTTETLFQLLFNVHRMRRWRIGTEKELRRLTPEDVRSYHATRYAPERVIVAVVGDLAVEQVMQLAEGAYGNWARPSPPVEGSPGEPEERIPRVRVLRGDVKRSLVSLGWRTRGTLHPDTPALDVAGSILGSGRGSRLYRALRVPGVAATVRADHYTPTEVGVFEISLEADAERVEEAVSRSLALVNGLAERGPTPAELERARALTVTAWAQRMESMEGRATALCEGEALGNYEILDELLERTLAVESQDVQRVVREHLPTDVASGVFYLARSDGADPFAAGWPPVVGRAATSPPPIPPVPARRVGPPSARVEKLPGGITLYRLQHVDVLIRPKRGSGLATLLLHFPGAPTGETEDTAGISWLVARLARRGAAGMSGEELAQAAESLGGPVGAGVTSETLGWGMTVRADALHGAARLLNALAREPHLADADLVIERQLQASDARRARDDMFRHPLQRVLAQAFPGHVYGLPVFGEPETVTAFGSDRVRGWWQQAVGRRPVVVVVGDVDADGSLAAIAPLAAWMPVGASPPEVSTAPGWMPGRASEERDKKQSALAMAFRATPYASADRFPLKVMGGLLSGLGGRLFEELREKRSLAYTVAALPWLGQQAGAVLCYLATAPDREDEARESMLRELERLAGEPPLEEEVERARNYVAGVTEISRVTGRAMAAEMLDAWIYGVVDQMAETPARLRAVSVNDVHRVATQVFVSDARAEYVVRGTGKRSGSNPA